jgi:ABC-type branched-subunit amino acid transport system substrate-binding protein
MAKLRSSVVLLVVLMVAGACGSSSKKPVTAPTTTAPAAATTTTQAQLTDSFRGVTSTTIKIGVAIVDYDCIKQFVDFNHGPQQAVEQSFIDNINHHGGILGRQIVPVYKTYCPIQPSVALDACQSLTQDAKVFAVLGVFAPTSPAAQLCLSRDHQTILIGHELQQATISQAPPGLLLTPDITDERRVNVLMSLLKQQGTLTGHKVGILADQDSQVPVGSVVKPALQSMGIQQGTEGVLTISGTDTSAAQTQLDSFIERWKSENVDTLFLAGLNVVSKQFVEKIRAQMPKVLLLADGESAAHDAAQGEVTGHKNPNPYEGIISANGPPDEDVWNTASVQNCAKIYEAASGQTVLGPNEVKPGPDGHTAQTYQAVEDFCGELDMFKQIAVKAGADLTNTTWTAAVNGFGPIQLVGSTYASLHQGKYDASDGFRLVSFDSTIPPQGEWKGLSSILNAAS